MNKQEEQRVLDIAATAGRVPRRVASGRTILATGQGEGRKKYLVLANGDELTRAGEYWFERTKQVKPNRHQMQLTTLGKKFYANKHTEYVIEIPVIIQVNDSKGKSQT